MKNYVVEKLNYEFTISTRGVRRNPKLETLPFYRITISSTILLSVEFVLKKNKNYHFVSYYFVKKCQKKLPLNIFFSFVTCNPLFVGPHSIYFSQLGFVSSFFNYFVYFELKDKQFSTIGVNSDFKFHMVDD